VETPFNRAVWYLPATLICIATIAPAGMAQKPRADRVNISSGQQRSMADYLKQHPLTMEDAVSIALATNPEVASALSATLKARGMTAEAKAALNPTAAIDAALTEFDNKTSIAFGNASFTSVNQWNPVFTAGVNMPLDISGILHSAITAANYEEAASRIELGRVRNSLTYTVKQSFISVLRAQAQLNAAKDTFNNAAVRQDMAEKSFKAGVAPRFDVIRAQTDVANAQQGVILATTGVKLAMATLKNAMGVDVSIPITISAEKAIVTPPAGPPVPQPLPQKRGAPNAPVEVSSLAPASVADPLDLGPDYSRAAAEALAHRPEILETQAHIEAAKRGIKLAHRSREISVGVNVGYTIFQRENVGAATLNVNIPLFDGGAARAREQQARADVSSLQSALQSAKDGVAFDVQRAYVSILQAEQRVVAAEAGLRQARESARLARVRYAAGVSQQSGVSPLLELSDSENSLASAELNQINALYDYNTAVADLDRAAGRYAKITEDTTAAHKGR
jgi:outer membrane protein